MNARPGIREPRVGAAVNNCEVVYLHPGDERTSAEPKVFTTVLGSCVAVCLWDSKQKVGGMAHYLLPNWDPERGPRSSRYGDVAIASLIEDMEKLNCRAATMQARIFGGACVLQVFRNQGKEHLGERNLEIARRILREKGILVLEQDAGGDSARKVSFNTSTGDAVVKRLGEVRHGA